MAKCQCSRSAANSWPKVKQFANIWAQNLVILLLFSKNFLIFGRFIIFFQIFFDFLGLAGKTAWDKARALEIVLLNKEMLKELEPYMAVKAGMRAGDAVNCGLGLGLDLAINLCTIDLCSNLGLNL